MEILITIGLWFICAFIGGSMAAKRNRSYAGGFVMGLFLGLLGLAIIALMGKQKE